MVRGHSEGAGRRLKNPPKFLSSFTNRKISNSYKIVETWGFFTTLVPRYIQNDEASL